MENKQEPVEENINISLSKSDTSLITTSSETDIIHSLLKSDDNGNKESAENKDGKQLEEETHSNLFEKVVTENESAEQMETDENSLLNKDIESNVKEIDNANLPNSSVNIETQSDLKDLQNPNKSESPKHTADEIVEELDNLKEPQVNKETESGLEEDNPNDYEPTDKSMESKENESVLKIGSNSCESELPKQSMEANEENLNTEVEKGNDESIEQTQVPELPDIPNSSTNMEITTKNISEDTSETINPSSTTESEIRKSPIIPETVDDDPNISENHFVECESYNNPEEVDADIEKHVEQDVLDTTDEQKKDTENEQTEFVQVNAEGPKDSEDGADVNKEVAEVDPIASDNFIQLNEDNEETHDVQGSNEELCIIPDTERIISQEEKEAASALPPLRDILEATTESADETNKEDSNSSCPIIIHKYDKDDLQFCSLPNCTVQKKVDYCYNNKEGVLCYICDDTCLKVFKSSSKDLVKIGWEDGNLRVKSFSICKEIRICKTCKKTTEDLEYTLTWEIMDFCNELCLTKYQKEIGSNCSNCKKQVNSSALGKYCVRFGNDIRQFCSGICLEEYKKDLKVCSYCQQDISTGAVGFLAPVGDKGQFKDFCSQTCMEKYDVMTNNRPPTVETGTTCNVCKIDEKKITIEYDFNGLNYYFCSEPCFVAFCFVNNIETGKCNMCKRNFNRTKLKENVMYYDNVPYNFCSNSCQNIYIIAHRKIVPCSWCKVKKYNFDMIRRYNKNDGLQINMCSVNCLTLYQVSLNAAANKRTACDYCKNKALVTYSLTMSDATIRNFCSYSCVMDFQGRFTKPPITLNMDEPIPTGNPQRVKRIDKETTNDSDFSTLPVITNVQSLAANGESHSPISHITTRKKSSQQLLNETVQIQVRQHYIVRPAPLPEQRNVATMCSIRKAHKSFTVKPTMVNKECQTDEREAEKILIPVPVPIYVPTPLHMFSAPVPFPVPFPIPVPVPIFIPTTRNSANGILKEIKKIQVKIPTDPYEAELLMMAEMVAGDKKEENNTDSESDIDGDGGGGDDGNFSPEPDATNTFGDDMLQMALKMATEMDEPAVDLEGALTANTITAQQGAEGQEQNVDNNTQLPLIDRQPLRGRKRGMRQNRGGGGKRGRRSHNVDVPMISQPQPQPNPPEPIEKPDANMCLKYTFGVNAWKQWVTTKNAELEKSSRRVKLFKTEILQLTADELNYSLCLFVKEVRKPNGAEYAPDTIYYLCLGIQQYLFENGRIDNIFCDPYYEKFTDCLDEVARKFSVLYNDSHYIVTRVEEEHLWESKQLGAHSPHVLLSTLMFFNTKHFNLTSVDEHMQLSFSHIMKHWKRNPNQPGASKLPGSRNVLLRFYPPQSAIQNNARKKKVYEQQENEENPLRCPVKLYEFYLSKCPESVKTRNDVFYLQPERSCVPDSPVWYSTMPLARASLEKMLHRVKMVKEINVALLTS